MNKIDEIKTKKNPQTGISGGELCWDSDHIGWTHLSAVRIGLRPSSQRRSEPRGAVVSPGNGHCIINIAPSYHTEPSVPELQAYEKAIEPAVRRRLGPRFDPFHPVVGNVFPNFAFLRIVERSFRMWHLRGPDKIEICSWTFVDKAAPPEVKDAVRLASIRSFSPSGMYEQDDMENWASCTRSCRGMVSRRYPLNYQMGFGHKHYSENVMAWSSDFRTSESHHRHVYQCWLDLMTDGI
jgi:3-phenylpropionate/trans-cinnamate dioxygenase alpha subunit